MLLSLNGGWIATTVFLIVFVILYPLVLAVTGTNPFALQVDDHPVKCKELPALVRSKKLA